LGDAGKLLVDKRRGKMHRERERVGRERGIWVQPKQGIVGGVGLIGNQAERYSTKKRMSCDHKA